MTASESLYAIIISNIQGNQWSTVQTLLNLCKDCTEVFVGELYIGNNVLKVCFSTVLLTTASYNPPKRGHAQV